MAFEFELPPAPTTDVKPKFGEGDLIRRSASTVPQPEKRQTEVAKLIDVSKCIGCKACQVACLEWNDRTANKSWYWRMAVFRMLCVSRI